jgi:Subtilase family
MGLTLLGQEPRANKAIVVFSSDQKLLEFRNRLENYSGIRTDFQYEYFDAVEALVPLEPDDRLGRLLALEPLPDGEITPLDMQLWHTGDPKEMNRYLEDMHEVLQSLSDGTMRISDRYVGEYLCIARIKVNSEMLELLLQEDIVKEIDRKPRPSFETPQEYNIPLSVLPEVQSPPQNNCGVLVIDSGVQRGHPLIGPALGEAAVFPDPSNQRISDSADDGDEKQGGHGTGVAGLAIYGDVAEGIRQKLFTPTAWLFSARVTDRNNEYDPDFLLESQLEEAVQYFTRNYSTCKVINISLGDSRLVFQDDQKQFKLAAKLDELAYRYRSNNLIFVVSAGNHFYDVDSNEKILTEYPNYLLLDQARIIEPATSAIALTVGSISLGTGSVQYPDDAGRQPIARLSGYPSPFTRTGFGIDGMIKPDLVDFGGDLLLDRSRIISNEPGVGILTLAKNYTGSMFRAYCGTSFSAPRVANIAAQLFTKFPNATSNMIRALLANSALIPTEIPPALQGDKAEQVKNQIRIYGYGQPNLDRSLFSAENYVVLQIDNEEMPVGFFRMYEIPALPSEFFEKSGQRSLSVTLAFDPPTRPTRGDSYLGVTMEFHVFKNLDPKVITQAFIKANSKNPTEEFANISLENLKKEHGSGVHIKLSPGSNLRKKGTLQKGQTLIKSKRGYSSDTPLYVVVSCARKWAKEGEVDLQRFSLVVSINHSNPEVDLYNRLRAQITTQVRIR